jgi:hypothetical protein
MGNITILDLLGAAVIAGFLLIMVYTSNARLNETLFTTGSDLVVQERMVNLATTIEEDFRRIGYCRNQRNIPDPGKIVVSAGKSSFAFLTDINDDGVVDTLRYYTGAAGGATATPNPRDMLLFRQVNDGKPIEMNIGLTAFNTKYFEVNGDSIGRRSFHDPQHGDHHSAREHSPLRLGLFLCSLAPVAPQDTKPLHTIISGEHKHG